MSTHDAVPFPLLPRIPRSDYTTVEVLHKVNIGGDQFEKRKATLFKLNAHDKELIADVMLEFRDACGPSILSLTTGPLRYAKFRELLEDPFRSEYDDVRTANNHPNTVAGFDQTMQSFMERYFVPTDYKHTILTRVVRFGGSEFKQHLGRASEFKKHLGRAKQAAPRSSSNRALRHS
jgi:hypothetical protein